MKNISVHKAPLAGPSPKVSIILLDWGCRERFHTLDWLGNQTVARDQYELIWVELYDRVVPEVMEKADCLITCNQTGMYHKHKGYNIGLLQARGDIITVCDSDAVFPPEFVQSVIESFELTTRPEPKPLVLMHHEQRSNHLYPRKLDSIEDVLRYDWVELWPNAGACFSVAKRDAFGFGGFDEDESLRGYICGPYELGWRMVNAGIPEVWHDKVFLWHFSHPHSNAKENKESWDEIVSPHIDFHAHAAVEAFSTGRLLPLTINAEVQQRRMAQRRIGTDFEAKFSRMGDRIAAGQVARAPTLETDRWYESDQAPAQPLVTAIVSSYNAERFMRSLLEDLEAQTIADQTEIVIIDSNSPQQEAMIVRDFQKRYHNIRFMRTSMREQSHITLNRCVRAARGKYITLACTDDRHRADAFEKMAAALEANPDIALVYGDAAITEKENQVLESADIVAHFRWPAYSRDSLFQLCHMGPQPMWRRTLHDQYGYYDEEFLSAGDYELYLRWAGAGERFMHLPEVLGLYLLNPQGNEHGQREISNKESDIAVRRYWKAEWGNRPAYGGSCVVPVDKGIKPDPSKLHPLGQTPLVSVIIPTHNRPGFLKDALASLLAQTYPHWEAIVVNDGGNSVEQWVLSLDQQGRIRYISHASNFGQVAAKNTGLRAVRGEVVCYLDDDDKYLPNHLETVVDAMRGTTKGFAHTRTEYVLEEMRDGKRTETGRGDPLAGLERTPDQLRVRNFIPINVWAHRRDCLKVTGLFDEKLPSLEDWELLLRFARHWELHDIPVLTAEVWQRAQVADNVSRKQMHTYLEVYKHIYAQHEDGGKERIIAGRAEMLRQLEAAGQGQPSAPTLAVNAYQRWIEKRSLQPIDGQIFAERMMLKWKEKPMLHLLLPLLPGQEAGLADTLDSLGGQLHSNWRLSVIAPMPSPDPIFGQIETLRWIELGVNETFATGMARARRESGGEWMVLLEPGVKFQPQALFSVADYGNLHPEWRLIYSDSDVISDIGERGDPCFRPEFNLDLLRATPYMGEVLFVRAAAWDAFDGSATGRGAEHYDLALNVLDQFGEASIGHIADVLYHAPATILRAEDDCAAALRRHLARKAVTADVDGGYLESTFRVTYQHDSTPLVSIIVPTRDRIEVLEPCINGLLSKTDYANLEIIVVDNQSSDPDILDYLDELERTPGGKIRVLRYPHTFNFAAICNLGVAAARGEYLLLLNNDVQAVQAQWLDRMMSHAQRAEVGVVGARLIFPETGKIQHAGVVLGITEVADHPYFKELGIDTPGYMGRTHVDQNFSAVSGACLLIRKKVYEQVRGMDEEAFQFLYGDVDLCLKVGQLGYKVVWTPFATLVHHGAATRMREETKPGVNAWFQERAALEAQTMYARWLPKIAHDPAYNRHLSLLKRDFSVEGDVVIDWDTNFHDRPRLLGLPLVGGAGEYRICAPFRALSNAGHVQADVVQMAKYGEIRVLTMPELVRADPDTLVMHAALTDQQLRMMPIYKQHHRSLKVFAMDDLVTNVPEQSPFYKHAYRDAKQRLRSALAASDRAIVTTEPLAEMCRGLIDDVRVIPNFLEKGRWAHLRSARRTGPKPRVGWAGAQQHHGDLALIIDLVKETAHEVDWIFMGMCLEELRPYVKEVHDFVLDYDEYTLKLASLNLDIAVAPLEQHPFNEAKSNLRLLEYGAMGWTVICSDVYPYQNAPVKRVSDDPQAWITALRDRIYDLDAAGVEGDVLRQWVLGNYLLEDHIEIWRAALVR